MLYIDYEANTEKEAVQLALESLGLKEEDVRVEILNKEKKGIFGIGKKDKAKVRVFYKEKNEIGEVIEKIKIVIEMLDKQATIEVVFLDSNNYLLNIDSAMPSHLIGRQGKNLEAIQNILNAFLAQQEKKYKVKVDVDRYYSKRYSTIVRQAVFAARKVLKTKEPILLEPMNSYERRLVHLEIQRKVKGVETNSEEGTGHTKSIRIAVAQS